MPVAPTEHFQIRPMELADIEQVQEIDSLSFSLPWPRTAYRYELVENQNSMLWVAETESPEGRRRVVGFVVVWLIIDEAHIATIAVHPELRRSSIGKSLLVTSLKNAIRRGYRTATLEVRQGNEAAQTLYRRFGFQVVGSRPRYYRDNNEDALIMTVKNLNDAYQEWLEKDAWVNSATQNEAGGAA